MEACKCGATVCEPCAYDRGLEAGRKEMSERERSLLMSARAAHRSELGFRDALYSAIARYKDE